MLKPFAGVAIRERRLDGAAAFVGGAAGSSLVPLVTSAASAAGADAALPGVAAVLGVFKRLTLGLLGVSDGGSGAEVDAGASGSTSIWSKVGGAGAVNSSLSKLVSLTSPPCQN